MSISGHRYFLYLDLPSSQLLRIDAVIRNTNLAQVKARLEQAGIHNFSVYDMDESDPDDTSFKPFYCVSRSKIEIICKNSQKDAVLAAISGLNPKGPENGIIYVNHLTTLIQLNGNDLQGDKLQAKMQNTMP